jgi:ATP-dependent Lhr-like helicase
MEMRGEVRRGYFVQGLPGAQFALPEVVEQVRAMVSNPGAAPDDGDVLVVMNACDPANLYGPAPAVFESAQQPPGVLTFSRIPSTWLVQHRGLPVLVVEDSGARMSTAPGANEGLIRNALQVLLNHLGGFQHRVTIETWNGAPVLESPDRSLLESLGFYRDYLEMTWERPEV